MSLIKNLGNGVKSTTVVGALTTAAEVGTDSMKRRSDTKTKLLEASDGNAIAAHAAERRKLSRNRFIGAIAGISIVSLIGVGIFDHETNRGEAFIKSLLPNFKPKTISQVVVNNTLKNMHLANKPIVAESDRATASTVMFTQQYSPNIPLVGRQQLPGRGTYTPDTLTDDIQAALDENKITLGSKQEANGTYALVVHAPNGSLLLQAANVTHDFSGATEGALRFNNEVGQKDTALGSYLSYEQLANCQEPFRLVAEKAIQAAFSHDLQSYTKVQTDIPGVKGSGAVLQQFASNPVEVDFQAPIATGDTAVKAYTSIPASEIQFTIAQPAETLAQLAQDINVAPSDMTVQPMVGSCDLTPTATANILAINGLGNH